MTDIYKSYTQSLSSPILDGLEITPDDGVELPQLTRALYVGTPGDVTVRLASGAVISLGGVLQWQRDGLPLPGQRAPAYEIQPEDAGAVLSVCVVAQNAAGTSQACSPLMPVWPNQTVSAWYTRRINPSSMTIQRAPGVSALPNVAGGAQIELT